MTISSTGNEVTDPGLGNGDSNTWVSGELDACTNVLIPIISLILGETQRSIATNTEHVRALADVLEDLPPILVHGPSGKVLDGAHRVRAAVLRGETSINAKIYSGSLENAFALAVNFNAHHGLPLSRLERTNAASRILQSHPQWSNRMIAGITGLAAGTIRNLRHESTMPDVRAVARIGKDGRIRPVNNMAGRIRASELLAERPTASTRAIAKEAGVSAATVLDVRRRRDAGQEVVPRQQRGSGRTAMEIPVPEVPQGSDVRGLLGVDVVATLAMLLKDPAIRLSAGGRFLLRWMIMSREALNSSQQIVDTVPDHCAVAVAKLARTYAVLWMEIASRLEPGSESDQGIRVAR